MGLDRPSEVEVLTAAEGDAPEPLASLAHFDDRGDDLDADEASLETASMASSAHEEGTSDEEEGTDEFGVKMRESPRGVVAGGVGVRAPPVRLLSNELRHEGENIPPNMTIAPPNLAELVLIDWVNYMSNSVPSSAGVTARTEFKTVTDFGRSLKDGKQLARTLR